MLRSLVVLVAFAGSPLVAQDKAIVPTQPPRAAQALIADAVAKAAVNHKTVLVKYGASWCGWCHKFDKFLEDTTGVGAIMRSHFEIVGLTVLEDAKLKALENPGGVEVAKSMGGVDINGTGIPFFFMLDSRGKTLGNSMVMPDKSNIGMPDAVIEVAGFDELLKITAPRMTASEHQRIKDYLDLVAGRVKAIPPL